MNTDAIAFSKEPCTVVAHTASSKHTIASVFVTYMYDCCQYTACVAILREELGNVYEQVSTCCGGGNDSLKYNMCQ